MSLLSIYRQPICKLNLRCIYPELKATLTERKILTRTSGIIVIGDEVLKGQVQDTNSQILNKNLYKLGIKVLKVSVVPDDVNVISSEIKKFSNEFDYVLTTGGIGPTHDDVTYESVAKAFDVPLHYDPTLTDICFNFFKTNDIHHPSLKLALVPQNSKLTFGFDKKTLQKSLYPNVSVNNVYVFPGVPHLCQRMFDFISDKLFLNDSRFYSKEMYLEVKEDKIACYLNNAVEKFPGVTFGSYPDFFHSYYSVKLTMESLQETKVEEAFHYLKKEIPSEYHIDYDYNPFVNKKQKLGKIKNELFFSTINDLNNAIKNRESDDIFFYFDGGKNSTLLLHMLSILFDENYPNKHINAIYLENNKKINNYISKSVRNYNLNILKLSKENLERFVNSDTKIILIKGTRKSDPLAKDIFNFFKNLKMINPLADWHYNDVWDAIRSLYLPYCELYDQGYTSICNSDPKQNPNLMTEGPRKDLIYYKKAYELNDKSLE